MDSSQPPFRPPMQQEPFRPVGVGRPGVPGPSARPPSGQPGFQGHPSPGYPTTRPLAPMPFVRPPGGMGRPAPLQQPSPRPVSAVQQFQQTYSPMIQPGMSPSALALSVASSPAPSITDSMGGMSLRPSPSPTGHAASPRPANPSPRPPTQSPHPLSQQPLSQPQPQHYPQQQPSMQEKQQQQQQPMQQQQQPMQQMQQNTQNQPPQPPASVPANRPGRTKRVYANFNNTAPPTPPPKTEMPVQQPIQQQQPMLLPQQPMQPQPAQQPMQPMQSVQPVQHHQQHPPTNPGAPPIPPPKNKIDPNQIPAPVPIQMKDQERYLVEPFGTCVKEQPVPLASTHFRTIDQGNCNPRFMRSTLKHVPQSVDLLRDTKLPWGMTVQPLAALHPQDEPIIVADTSNGGPVRCQRCKAYINPWCRFTDGGRKFICNLCGFDSIVPDDYFSALDMSGRRMDADQRLELQRGTIEFAVPQDYWTRQPTHLHLVFAIDVTWSSIRSGMLRVFCQTLKHVLYEAQLLDPHVRIAIITFDTSLYFYNLNSKSEQIGMLVVPELEDAFVPLADGLFVDPQESRPLIEELLDQLPTYFEHTKAPSAAFYPAVKACLSSMTKTGGKICVLQSSLPAVGPNALKNRDDIKLYGTDKEKQLFTPQNPAYLALAKECVANGVCVDLWLFPMQAYLDVSTIGLLPALTGGDTHLFPDFDPRIHGDAFAHDLQHSLVREQGFHCALRLRCSNGVAVKDQLGNFDMSNATDLELGGTDADKSFAFELAYDDKLSADQDVYFQCALLYTTRDGHRRVRVHNLCLSVTTTVSGVFRHADLDTAMNLLAKRAVTNSMKKGLSAVTTELDNDCMMILTAYRKHCAASASPGQLILPESFKLLPLMTLGLKKTPALRKDLALKSDVRAHHMRRLKAMPVSETIQWFYPTMIQVDKWVTMDPRQLGNVANVWPLERLSHMRLRPDGIYLIDAGDARFLWIGQGVSTDLLQGVFGVDQLKDIPTNMTQISPQSHAFSERYQQLVAALDERRPWQPQCAVIRQGIDLENEFICVLGEDDTFGESNYVDYLCMIHKRIQAELEREKQDSFVTSASYWAYRY